MITGAQYLGHEWDGNVGYRVRVRLTDSVDGQYDSWLNVTGSTVNEIRDSATREIMKINDLKTRKNVLVGIAVGTAIPVSLVEPQQTAADIARNDWQNRANRLLRARQLRDAGLAVPTDAELAPFITGLNTDYLAGYV